MKRQKVHLKNYSSTILTCIGALGVVATSVMAVRATPKAIKLIKEAAEEKDDELTNTEVVIAAAPAYIPAVISGTATIVCIFGANVLNKRKQAALVSAYSLLDTHYKEYRKKLVELHGKEADTEIQYAMAREHCNFHQLGLDVPDRKAIFYDEISKRSVVCYEREIMDAEYHLNHNFVLRGYAPLNEFYAFLGLPQTEYGETIGWSVVGGYAWIDFEHRLISNEDGMNVYAIDMIFPPDADYLRDWE